MAKKPGQNVTLVATFISPGVSAGAAGFMIVNGKIVRIGPRGPAFAKISEAVRELSAPKRGKRNPSQ
jgi:hypothetical protein